MLFDILKDTFQEECKILTMLEVLIVSFNLTVESKYWFYIYSLSVT